MVVGVEVEVAEAVGAVGSAEAVAVVVVVHRAGAALDAAGDVVVPAAEEAEAVDAVGAGLVWEQGAVAG